MLRTLLRTSSDRNSDGSSKGSLSMPSSPSFSDFSMGVGQEDMSVDVPQTQTATHSDVPSGKIHARPCQRHSLDSRFSFGSSTSSDSSPTEQGKLSRGNSGVPIPQQERSFLNHFMPSAAKYAHGTAPADTKPPYGKYPEKKIDGMDYYEFCELIRSNSL